MTNQIPPISRLVMFLGTGLLLLMGFAAAWAVWHIVADHFFRTCLTFYAEGTRQPLATFRGRGYEMHLERSLGHYPPVVIDAVLIMEDRRFYRHFGVDLLSVVRAAWANANHGTITQGGSTLTQQLARMRYLTRERTFSRKAKEAILALVLEAALSKRDILERYLNEVYLGQYGTYEVYGIAAASGLYFGKEPGALRPAEAALLVGLIRSPNTTSPLVSLRHARERRDLVLRRLWEEGTLQEADYRQALREPVRAAMGSTLEVPYFLDYVRKELETKLPGVAKGRRINVFTTLDGVTQQAARQAVVQGLLRLDRQHMRGVQNPLQGALVALDVETGAVKAMVGGRSYRRSQFNRAVQARRQPGSLFKPFVYLAAFETRRDGKSLMITPATLIEDRPMAVTVGKKGWTPRNFGGRYNGKVRVREALEQSLNAATVAIGEQVGLGRVIEEAMASGIESPLRRGPATLLGASEVSLLEITAAYNTLARGGEWIKPHAIWKVEDERGRVLFEDRRTVRRAASPQAAFLVTSLLQGAVERGTAAAARRLGLARPAAGKTGTSSDLRDAWFVGYTPDLVAGVWVGMDSGTSLRMTGAQAALPLWVQFIERASAGRPVREFRPPQGIVTAKVDPASGLRLSDGCGGGVDEIFIRGTEPAESCPAGEFALFGFLRRLFLN